MAETEAARRQAEANLAEWRDSLEGKEKESVEQKTRLQGEIDELKQNLTQVRMSKTFKFVNEKLLIRQANIRTL